MITSTVHVAHTLPTALQVLFPKRHLSVATAHGKDVAREAPRHTPNNIGKLPRCCRRILGCSRGRVKGRLNPWCGRRVLGPNEHRLVL